MDMLPCEAPLSFLFGRPLGVTAVFSGTSVTQKRGIMTIYKFSKEIQERMEERLGAGYTVRLQKVQKNNGVHLQGLVIRNKEQNISPTIYLDDFYEAYCNGYTMKQIIESILKIYEEDTPKGNIDMSFFKEFQSVKDRICYRLIDEKQNGELLQKIPHVKFLDLAVCFYYAYQSEELGNGSILIYYTHLEMWNVTKEELLALAHENTPRLFPWECSSMKKVIEELMQEEFELNGEYFLTEEDRKQFFKDVPMHILSNGARTYGAACILYPGVLEQLALKYQCDFYILPSSIHEVILLREGQTESVWELKQMIAEVNRTQVEIQEVLSNSLYYYSLKKRQIEIL